MRGIRIYRLGELRARLARNRRGMMDEKNTKGFRVSCRDEARELAKRIKEMELEEKRERKG